MTCAESLADGVREREDKIATAAWKKAYLKTLSGTNGPPGKLRAVLLALWELSDPMGRTWHSLRSISLQANTPKRTVQRHLDELEDEGWIEKTPKTWAQLTLEQATLDFPLPYRDDEANAPVLILLTYKGKAAMEEMKLRIATPSQSGQNPRPNGRARPLAKVANDPDISVLDLQNKEVGDPRCRQAPPISSIGHLDPAESQGWQALLNAYDRHYIKTYIGRPTAPIPVELAKPLGGHIADVAVVLRARLHAKNVTISLEDAIGKIADKAMSAWLASPGSDGTFLRKVGHQLKALQIDLPRCAKQAVREILAEMSPPPPPRTTNVVAFTPRSVVVQSVPEPQPAAGPAPESSIQGVFPQILTIGEVNLVKQADRTDAPEPNVPESSVQVPTNGKADQVKRADRTDAPEPSIPEASPQVPTNGKADLVKRADRTDAPIKQAIEALPHVPTTSELDPVKRSNCRDAPGQRVSEARKLVDRLGKPAWCDEKMALEMLHARSLDVVLETVSRLRIDEKSMTRPKIYAMIFIALYGPEARNDNRC